jgi:hypothetical protein
MLHGMKEVVHTVTETYDYDENGPSHQRWVDSKRDSADREMKGNSKL